MRAARVGPHVGEGDLFRRPLLQQHAVLAVEQEDGEGPVQEPLVDIGHEMACGRTARAGPSQPRSSLSITVPLPCSTCPSSSLPRACLVRTELLASRPNRHVVVIYDNAHLIQEADLLLVVALERLPARVDGGVESR